MEWYKRIVRIEQWTYKELFIVIALFIVANLLAPRGFVHWVLVQQDIRRVKVDATRVLKKIESIDSDITGFKSSDLIKEQKLRELGYLKESEISLEFIPATRKNTARVEAPPTSTDESDLAR